MSEKILSIIIPMYNSEEYIKRTLNSVFESNLPSELYEVFVVDDGSKDRGPDLVDEMAAEHSNLFLVSQENGGSSKARNTGIERVKTDYIWFIDSDDKVEEDLSPMLKVIKEHPNMDIYSFSYKWIKNGEYIGCGGTQPAVKHDVEMKGRDAVVSNYSPGSVCGLLLRRDFLLNKKLRFKEGITQQDVELTYRMFSKAEKVYFSPAIIYNYIIREDSISKAVDVKRKTKYILDKIQIIKSFTSLSEEFKEEDEQLASRIKQQANGAQFGLVFSLFKNRKEWKSLGINTKVLEVLKSEHLYPLKGPYKTWKHKLMSFLLNKESLLK